MDHIRNIVLHTSYYFPWNTVCWEDFPILPIPCCLLFPFPYPFLHTLLAAGHSNPDEGVLLLCMVTSHPAAEARSQCGGVKTQDAVQQRRISSTHTTRSQREASEQTMPHELLVRLSARYNPSGPGTCLVSHPSCGLLKALSSLCKPTLSIAPEPVSTKEQLLYPSWKTLFKTGHPAAMPTQRTDAKMREDVSWNITNLLGHQWM